MRDTEAGRSRRIRFAASVTAALSLLSGVLVFAEHDAGARTVPNIAQAINLPTIPSTLPGSAVATPTAVPVGDPVAGGAQELASVQTALATIPPSSIACAGLLTLRAAAVAAFNTLIAAAPTTDAAALIRAEEATALGLIDAVLRSLGCGVPSGQ